MKKVTSSKIPAKDDWVAVAITDDDLVVELLLRLKHAGTVVSDNPAVILPPLRWGIRQRRSRSSRFGGGGGVLVSLKKDVDSVRASPKTPLSWSGGSGSGGGSASPSADGFEDNSRQASCSTSTGSGSKVTFSFPYRDFQLLPLDLVFSLYLLSLNYESGSSGEMANPSSRWIIRFRSGR
jgi:hypothetical protein